AARPRPSLVARARDLLAHRAGERAAAARHRVAALHAPHVVIEHLGHRGRHEAAGHLVDLASVEGDAEAGAADAAIEAGVEVFHRVFRRGLWGWQRGAPPGRPRT